MVYNELAGFKQPHVLWTQIHLKWKDEVEAQMTGLPSSASRAKSLEWVRNHLHIEDDELQQLGGGELPQQ